MIRQLTINEVPTHKGEMMNTILVAFSILTGILIASTVMASLFGFVMQHGDRLDSDVAAPSTCQSCALSAQDRLDSFCRAQRREINGRVECRYRREG
jgi:hypothetical protein